MTTPNISEAAREAVTEMIPYIDTFNGLGESRVLAIVQRLLDSTQAEHVAEIERLKRELDISLGQLSVYSIAGRDDLRTRVETAERERDAMRYAINEALKINREVNKLPIGNFYLAETMEGFLRKVMNHAR